MPVTPLIVHPLRGALVLHLFLAGEAGAQVQVPPPPRGFGTSQADVVVDQAGVLSAATEERLNRIAFEVRAGTGGELAFVTLPDIGGRSVEEMALRIGREWGVGANAPIGSRVRNAGIVVLVIPRETNSEGRGRIRIEVGQGAEGFINDARAGDIQREAIPFFQRGDYDGAFVLIATRLAERFAAEFGVSFDSAVVPPSRPVFEPPAGDGGGSGGSLGGLLFFLLIMFLVFGGMGRAARRGGGSGCLWLLLSMAMSSHGHRGRRSGWGGGGFGGGSFGGGGGFGGFGGGGGFSGGGSSGSW